MQHEVKKEVLIINELLTMLLLNGAEEIDVKIKRMDERTEITFIHYQCKYEDQFIEKLRYNLTAQRQCEVEGYYWQLVGEDDCGDELHLVGVMIDEAQVEKRDDDLHIHLVRKIK